MYNWFNVDVDFSVFLSSIKCDFRVVFQSVGIENYYVSMNNIMVFSDIS